MTVRVGYTAQVDSNGDKVLVLNYHYKISGVGFLFHLLCEVGEPKQKQMKKALRNLCNKLNARVEQREFVGKPHFADVLVVS